MRHALIDPGPCSETCEVICRAGHEPKPNTFHERHVKCPESPCVGTPVTRTRAFNVVDAPGQREFRCPTHNTLLFTARYI